jgi:hypothetical protein
VEVDKLASQSRELMALMDEADKIPVPRCDTPFMRRPEDNN